MSIDYDAIRQENIKKYGTDIDQYGPILLENLYSDQTHFIFELLQNAEDAKASQAQFRLYSDRLEFEHDGCPFNEENVRGICGLAAGTKRNDVNMIGKFGIGFKSVYAHTSSPEIHSADEHFAIDNYVQPRLIDAFSTATKTLFVFPFNHADKTTEESHHAIAKRLEDLSARSLLFLRNIKDISFNIEDGHSGNYERRIAKELEMDFAKIMTLTDKQFAGECKENWLVFEKDVAHLINEMDLTDEELQIAGDTTLAVQIAFLVSDFESDDKPAIDMLAQSRLSVFFPTERETNLGFLIQGPYQTNSARDDIPKDVPFNIALAKESGELVVGALLWLRDRDWLTVDVLETMPLAHKKNEYGYEKEINPYRWTLIAPVYERVKQALMNEALIPTYGGGYVAAKDARIAGSVALRELLKGPQLKQLFKLGDQARWISEEITEGRTQNLWRYFTTILDIEEIVAEKFVGEINDEFLIRQSDDWIRNFYEYASGFNYRSYSYFSPFNSLKRKAIIRLEDGSHVQPFHWNDEPRAYLPTEHDSEFPTVKREVCNSAKAMDFLKNVGLKEPNIVDEVRKHILPKYRDEQEIDDAERQQDFELIIQALSVDSQQQKNALTADLKRTRFLMAESAMGDVAFRMPGELYFRNPTLEMYFDGNPDGWFISPEYQQYFNNLEQLRIFDGVRLWIRKPNHLGYTTLQMPDKGSESYPHKRGLDGFDPDFTIDGLEFALTNPTVERSLYIWNKLLLPKKHGIVGTVESSPVQSFPSHRTTVEENVLSHVGWLVRSSAWLPDQNGDFFKPSKLLLDNLPDGFRKDNDLANALGMIVSTFSIDDAPEDIKAIVAAAQGHSPEELKEALALLQEKKRKEREPAEVVEPDEFPKQLGDDFEQVGSPTPPVPPNPDIDSLNGDPEDRLIDDIVSEPDPEERYRIGLRRIWETKNKETRRFLESEYGGLCQICNSTFPKRNRAPYFEAVHLIPRTSARWLDHPRNALCLCADHSARFQYGERGTPDSDIIDQIRSYDGGPDHHVTIILCDGLVTVRFFARHIRELCVAAGGNDCR